MPSALRIKELRDLNDNVMMSDGALKSVEIDGIKLKSSGNSITKSDGTTSVLSESGGTVTINADEANVGSNALVVDASGSVGIGTSSPAKKLQSTDSNGDVLRLQRSDAFTGIWDVKIGSSITGDFTIVDALNNTKPFIIEKGSGINNAMRIDSSGNVGINNDSPSYQLQVNTSSTTDIGIYSNGKINGSIMDTRSSNYYVGGVYWHERTLHTWRGKYLSPGGTSDRTTTFRCSFNYGWMAGTVMIDYYTWSYLYTGYRGRLSIGGYYSAYNTLFIAWTPAKDAGGYDWSNQFSIGTPVVVGGVDSGYLYVDISDTFGDYENAMFDITLLGHNPVSSITDDNQFVRIAP